MPIERVHVNILGSSFLVETDETREYMDRIISYLRKKTEDIGESTGIEDPLKISILSGIYLVDELFREKDNTEQRKMEENLADLTERMITRIDQSLGKGDDE